MKWQNLFFSAQATKQMASPILSYQYPVIPQNGGGGLRANDEVWREFVPLNYPMAGGFRSDLNAVCTFNIASNSEFLKSTMGFLSFTVTPRNSQGQVVLDASIRNSKQGISRLFKRIRILVGSTVLEDLEYDDLMSLWYPLMTPGRKEALKDFEGYGDDRLFTLGARTFCMPLNTSLFSTEQLIPLPLIFSNGGLTIECSMADASNLITSSTNSIAYLTLDAPRYKAQCVIPPVSFTSGLISAVRGGRSAHIPTSRIRVFRSVGNGSQQQLVTIPIGGVSSIDSVETVLYTNDLYAQDPVTKVTPDRYTRYTSAFVTDYRIEAAGLSQPANLTFPGGAGNAVEALMMTLLSKTGNVYKIGDETSISGVDFTNSSYRLGLTFTTNREEFATGLTTIGASSPNILITINTSTPLGSNCNIVSYVQTSQLITFTGSVIEVTEIF